MKFLPKSTGYLLLSLMLRFLTGAMTDREPLPVVAEFSRQNLEITDGTPVPSGYDDAISTE